MGTVSVLALTTFLAMIGCSLHLSAVFLSGWMLTEEIVAPSNATASRQLGAEDDDGSTPSDDDGGVIPKGEARIMGEYGLFGMCVRVKVRGGVGVPASEHYECAPWADVPEDAPLEDDDLGRHVPSFDQEALPNVQALAVIACLASSCAVLCGIGLVYTLSNEETVKRGEVLMLREQPGQREGEDAGFCERGPGEPAWPAPQRTGWQVYRCLFISEIAAAVCALFSVAFWSDSDGVRDVMTIAATGKLQAALGVCVWLEVAGMLLAGAVLATIAVGRHFIGRSRPPVTSVSAPASSGTLNGSPAAPHRSSGGLSAV